MFYSFPGISSETNFLSEIYPSFSLIIYVFWFSQQELFLKLFQWFIQNSFPRFIRKSSFQILLRYSELHQNLFQIFIEIFLDTPPRIAPEISVEIQPESSSAILWENFPKNSFQHCCNILWEILPETLSEHCIQKLLKALLQEISLHFIQRFLKIFSMFLWIIFLKLQ